MLLIICVDSDDDIGDKTGLAGPIVGRKEVEEAALAFGTQDPEDSDLNALFEAMRLYDAEEEGEAEIVVLTGSSRATRSPDRVVAEQLDQVLEEVPADSAVVVTDGAEDEGVIPVVESRLRIDGVNRTVVRQAENLENAYHVIKQLYRDPETRGTILIPLGILVLIYPLDLLMRYLNYPNAAMGVATALLGGYFLIKGFGLDDRLEEYGELAQEGLYNGQVSLITYLIAAGLSVIGIAAGFQSVQTYTQSAESVITGVVPLAMAFVNGSILWLTVGGVVSSIGRILDEYIQKDEFPRVYLNAPFYIVAMGFALNGVSGFFLGDIDEVYLAAIVVISIGIGAASTAVFGGLGGSGVEEETESPSDEVVDVE
jgi:putative membrane protein